MTETRKYGLVIRTVDRYGTTYVEAELASRSDEYQHPIGCGESYDRPKHLAELELDGLGLHGFITDSKRDDGLLGYLAHEIRFRDVHSINERQARRMVRTLSRINRQFDNSHAHEPGDRLMALAKALRLEFVVEDRAPAGGHHAGSRWYWMDVAEGRNRFRAMIEEARLAVTERKFGKVERATA